MNRFVMRNILGYSFLIPFVYYLFTGRAFYAAGMCVIISGMFWFTRVGEEDIIDEKRSFLDQVRQRLHVEHVYVKMRKKPLKRSAFGGFAIPVLPFFASIGYSEMIDKREVMVHELVHDNVFIYGFQTALFYLLIAFINAAVYFGTWDIIIPTALGVLFFLVIQEVVAFTRTYKISRELGFESRMLSKNVVLKYIIYYSAWISFVGLIIFVQAKSGSNLLALAVLVVGAVLLNKAFYYFGKWFNKTFKDNKNSKVYKLNQVNKL